MGGRSVLVGGRGVLVAGRTVCVRLEAGALVGVPTKSGGRVSRGRLVFVIHLVQVGVGEGVRVSVEEAVNVGRVVSVEVGVRLGVNVRVGTGEIVAVLKRVADGSTVGAVSKLGVAVGVPAPVFGMTRSTSYNAAFLAPSVNHSTPNAISALTRIRRITKYSLVFTSAVPVRP